MKGDKEIHDYALSFDGPGYRKETGFDPNQGLKSAWDSPTFAPLTYEEKRCCLYFLQRDLCKWGLVYEDSNTSEWWHKYRALYTHLKEVDASQG
jgi:hypothetical protein